MIQGLTNLIILSIINFCVLLGMSSEVPYSARSSLSRHVTSSFLGFMSQATVFLEDFMGNLALILIHPDHTFKHVLSMVPFNH